LYNHQYKHKGEAAMIDLKGPTTSEIKKFIKEKSMVEFCLIGNKTMSGQILWHDDASFHIRTGEGKEITIQKAAVLYYLTAQ
jgi:hypothetical protein